MSINAPTRDPRAGDVRASTRRGSVPRPSTVVALAAAALVAAACGGPSLDPIADGPPTPAPTSAASNDEGAEVAWDHLGVVEGLLDDQVAAMVAESDADVAEVWQQHGFDGDAPSIAEDRVLLLLGRPDNACPDELTSLEVTDGRLATTWQEPPGGCIDPLILWVHAIDVHRSVLAPEFTYGPDEPFAGELTEVTIAVDGVAGDAPPAPRLPEAMSDAELAAVFDGHPVRPCGPEHDPIAAAFGDPERWDDTDDLSAGDPAEDAAIRDIDAAMATLATAGFDVDERVSGLVDRSQGPARAAVVAHLDEADEVQAVLDDALGTDTVVVWPDPWDPSEVLAAQEALTALMGPADGPGSIVSSSGPPGPVQVGMIDPTRDALDRVAATVQAALVCIEPLLSGQAPQPAG